MLYMNNKKEKDTYLKRFFIFQCSKYMWALAFLSLIAPVITFEYDNSGLLMLSVIINVFLFYTAYKMTNQYRCINPNCNKILIFAHGSSGTSGPSTHSKKCPHCETIFI